MKESYAGLLIEEEISNINKIINDYKKPFTAILGGAKVSDKIKVIEKFIELADNIIIGGAMSNTFIKELKYRKFTLRREQIITRIRYTWQSREK